MVLMIHDRQPYFPATADAAPGTSPCYLHKP